MLIKLFKHNFASLCLTQQPWLAIIVFVAGPQARRLCPDLAEEDEEGREIRLRGNKTSSVGVWFSCIQSFPRYHLNNCSSSDIEKAKKRAKRLRKRNTQHYALRQFRDENSAKIRPCEVSLETLEVPPEMIEIAKKRSIEMRNTRTPSTEFVVRSDNDDSVDDLLKSSSDSDSGKQEILSITHYSLLLLL